MDLEAFAEHFKSSFPHLIGKKLLVSLSGGVDSVALLSLLHSADLGLELEAAHVHHGVRGDEADRDASFCANLCAERSIPFHLLRIDPNAPLGAGREGTWRQLRYEALLRLSAAGSFGAVATGHHRDDVAEGFLVQLLRGGGPRAIAGIAESNADRVIRPLLPWSRAELRFWVEERRIPWREDSSNLDLTHLRNLVRHRLLPVLEEASPSLRTHLVHLAKTLARDESYLSEELAARAVWIDPWHPDRGVPISAVADLPPPLRARWLHAQARLVGLSRVTRRQAELFEALVADRATGAVTLCGRWCIRRARGELWLEPPQTPPPYRIDLTEGGWVDLPLPGWRVRFGPPATSGADPRWRFRFESGARPVVRSPKADDLVEIDGKPVRAAKLLSRALPRHLRSTWPVCCESDRIQWIPGVWRGPEPATRVGKVVEVMRRERSSCAF